MKFGTVVLLTLFLTIKCSQLNAQEWKKFVPLSTTRTDVESLLGPGGEGFEVVYQLKDGALSIEYSTGPCTSERKGGWDVPKNVKKLSELHLSPAKFRKVVSEHLPPVTFYINDEDGITYAIQNGNVDYVEFGPAKKYDNLYCKG